MMTRAKADDVMYTEPTGRTRFKRGAIEEATARIEEAGMPVIPQPKPLRSDSGGGAGWFVLALSAAFCLLALLIIARALGWIPPPW